MCVGGSRVAQAQQQSVPALRPASSLAGEPRGGSREPPEGCPPGMMVSEKFWPPFPLAQGEYQYTPLHSTVMSADFTIQFSL